MNFRDDQIKSLFVLNATPGLNARCLQPFLDLFGSPQALISEQVRNELRALGGEGARFATRLEEALNKVDPEKELQSLQKHGARVISYTDREYPARLREIADPPILLYMRGTIPLVSTPCLSVVGSRNASFYGLETAEKFSFALAEAGICIVSGLARGIDAAAHLGALKAQGRTVAVIGCGLDIVYPRENAVLFDRISREGAVFSEFPVGTKPMAYHFPKRNRIIAGMSQGVLVVEASMRSGSLITSRLALEEGRDVYSIPGRIDFFGSRGNNDLIKQGAKLVDSPEEILLDFSETLSKNKLKPQAEEGLLQLDEAEKILLTQIPVSPIEIEELAAKVGMDPAKLQAQLMGLELKAKIQRVSGGKLKRVEL